jgi:hypothetical protein
MRLMNHLVPLAILLTATLRAQYPPDQLWQTIRTQHFDVVFPHLIEAAGQRAANALETMYTPLANSLGASLQRHTVVILANENITRLNIGSVPLFPHMSRFSMMPQQDFWGTNDWITTLTVSEARRLVQTRDHAAQSRSTCPPAAARHASRRRTQCGRGAAASRAWCAAGGEHSTSTSCAPHRRLVNYYAGRRRGCEH